MIDFDSAQNRDETGLYSSSSEALKKVSSEYEYWSGKLTETSLQMSYAIIAANWLVFGSVNGILGQFWAKLSLLLVMLALANNIAGSWALSELLRTRVDYGETDRARWDKEFRENSHSKSPWPFTKDMELVGRSMRIAKAACTLASGATLIVGAILR